MCMLKKVAEGLLGKMHQEVGMLLQVECKYSSGVATHFLGLNFKRRKFLHLTVHLLVD